MTPEAALCDTVKFTAVRFDQCVTRQDIDPWVVTGGVLMAQQAAVLALRAAGDAIPAQAGGTELLLRAASKDRLPAPFTLPFGAAARQSFDRLVDARNAFMHPRGVLWDVSTDTLSCGLPVAVRVVRHLTLTQPVLQDLISPDQQTQIREDLDALIQLVEFFDPAIDPSQA